MNGELRTVLVKCIHDNTPAERAVDWEDAEKLADAIMAVLPPSLTAAQREAIAQAAHDGIQRYLAGRIDGYAPKAFADESEPDRSVRYAQADAIMAVLPPAITAEQWEALGVVLAYVEGWNAVDRPVLRPDAQKMRDAVALLRALATGQPS
jgi:hypothetical protein